MGLTRQAQGEDELIETYFAPLAAGFEGALGLKDDCARLEAPAGHELVLTMDAVAEGVHFFANDAAADIAWKALAVNVSDLVAKGARPLVYLMSLAFPERPRDAWLGEFAAGLGAAQDRFGIVLAGGDTDRRPGPFAVTITAIGSVPKGRMVRRTAGKAGDRLFLSGSVGDSALGLMLRRDASCASALGLDADGARHLLARYLRPEPRLGLAPVLSALASAGMDVSDGLVKDCGRLASASGLSATLDGAKLPFSPPLRMAIGRHPELFRVAVTGGDDYEVLAAVPPERAQAFAEAAAGVGVTVAEIGSLAAGSGVAVTGPDGAVLAIDTPGWDHFG